MKKRMIGAILCFAGMSMQAWQNIELDCNDIQKQKQVYSTEFSQKNRNRVLLAAGLLTAAAGVVYFKNSSIRSYDLDNRSLDVPLGKGDVEEGLVHTVAQEVKGEKAQLPAGANRVRTANEEKKGFLKTCASNLGQASLWVASFGCKALWGMIFGNFSFVKNIRATFTDDSYHRFFAERNGLFHTIFEFEKQAAYLDPYNAVHLQIPMPITVQFSVGDSIQTGLKHILQDSFIKGDVDAHTVGATAAEISEQSERMSDELRQVLTQHCKETVVRNQYALLGKKHAENPQVYFIYYKEKVKSLMQDLEKLRLQLIDALGFSLAYIDKQKYESSLMTLIYKQDYKKLLRQVNECAQYLERLHESLQNYSVENVEAYMNQLQQESKAGFGLAKYIFEVKQTAMQLWKIKS